MNKITNKKLCNFNYTHLLICFKIGIGVGLTSAVPNLCGAGLAC